MNRLLLPALASLLALLAAPAAHAASLPVSYFVDEKALKEAIAGTSLTFALYDDSTCAGTAVHSENVLAENVQLVSRLKLGAAKGAEEKPPKTSELKHTLSGVTATGNLFLKVTGTGVTPVGDACQAQSAQVAQVPAEPLPGASQRLTWHVVLTSADEFPSPPNTVRTRSSTFQAPVGSLVTVTAATITANLSGCSNWAGYVSPPSDFEPPFDEVDFGYNAGSNVVNGSPVSGLGITQNVTMFPQPFNASVACYNGAFSGDVVIDLTFDFVGVPGTID